MRETFKIHSTEALSLIEFARKQKISLHLTFDGEHTYLEIPDIFELHHKCYLDELVRMRACLSNSSESDSLLLPDCTSTITSQNKNCQPGFETQVLY